MTTPVYLVTGLLGSGKTTFLQNILKQRPPAQHWAIVVNDFGDINIDAALIPHDNVIEVSGGCVCCSLQHTLTKTLSSLVNQGFDAIWIEPSGVAQPGEVLRLLNQIPAFKLARVIALLTPMQLTPARWQKSEQLRALVHTADTLVLNKLDLATAEEIAQAKALLNSLERPPFELILTTQAQADCSQICQPAPTHPPSLWHKTCTHQTHIQPYATDLPGVEAAQYYEEGTLVSIAYRWSAEWVFSRPRIRDIFAQHPPIVRAKGLLRMGKHWQALQWSDGQLKLQTQPWHRDSRLLLFMEKSKQSYLKQFEEQLSKGLFKHE